MSSNKTKKKPNGSKLFWFFPFLTFIIIGLIVLAYYFTNWFEPDKSLLTKNPNFESEFHEKSLTYKTTDTEIEFTLHKIRDTFKEVYDKKSPKREYVCWFAVYENKDITKIGSCSAGDSKKVAFSYNWDNFLNKNPKPIGLFMVHNHPNITNENHLNGVQNPESYFSSSSTDKTAYKKLEKQKTDNFSDMDFFLDFFIYFEFENFFGINNEDDFFFDLYYSSEK